MYGFVPSAVTLILHHKSSNPLLILHHKKFILYQLLPTDHTIPNFNYSILKQLPVNGGQLLTNSQTVSMWVTSDCERNTSNSHCILIINNALILIVNNIHLL